VHLPDVASRALVVTSVGPLPGAAAGSGVHGGGSASTACDAQGRAQEAEGACGTDGFWTELPPGIYSADFAAQPLSWPERPWPALPEAQPADAAQLGVSTRESYAGSSPATGGAAPSTAAALPVRAGEVCWLQLGRSPEAGARVALRWHAWTDEELRRLAEYPRAPGGRDGSAPAWSSRAAEDGPGALDVDPAWLAQASLSGRSGADHAPVAAVPLRSVPLAGDTWPLALLHVLRVGAAAALHIAIHTALRMVVDTAPNPP
jgi:hypothetical protein